MRSLLALATVASILFASQQSLADEQPKHKWVGLGIDVGVPDGLGVGVVVSPYFYWLKTTASYTNNYFTSGGRIGVTLDPVKFVVGPTFTTEYGFTARFNASDTFGAALPETSCEYVNLQPGIEFGKPNGFRFFLRGGVSSLWIHGHDFSRMINNPNVTMGDGRAQVWIFPTLKVGATILIF